MGGKTITVAGNEVAPEINRRLRDSEVTNVLVFLLLKDNKF
jgi:hypothetical protein